MLPAALFVELLLRTRAAMQSCAVLLNGLLHCYLSKLSQPAASKRVTTDPSTHQIAKVLS
jgi:hypothetical protein